MSKWIDEIVKDIKDNPNSWKVFGECGIRKDNIILDNFYNGALLSCCDVNINGIDKFFSTTWRDRYKLEKTYQWWCKQASLDLIR